MVKHKLARKQIDKFLMTNGKGNIYDIEDYIMSRNKNCPNRKTILGILSKDPKYVLIDTQTAIYSNGRKTEIKVWTLREV